MAIEEDDARQRLADARYDVGLCSGCYANRRGRFPVRYDFHAFCWVCKITSKSPRWLASIIRKLDRAGAWRGDM